LHYKRYSFIEHNDTTAQRAERDTPYTRGGRSSLR